MDPSSSSSSSSSAAASNVPDDLLLPAINAEVSLETTTASTDEPDPAEFAGDGAAEARAYKKKKRRRRRGRSSSEATTVSEASETEDDEDASGAVSPRNAHSQLVVELERTISLEVTREKAMLNETDMAQLKEDLDQKVRACACVWLFELVTLCSQDRSTVWNCCVLVGRGGGPRGHRARGAAAALVAADAAAA